VSAADAAVAAGLPGEPWLVWSFMQAAGFVLLIVGEFMAITCCSAGSESGAVSDSARDRLADTLLGIKAPGRVHLTK
jgi:hypothetical protein